MKKLLILGASGLVGKALIEECQDGFDLYGTYYSSSTILMKDKQYQLDIQQSEMIKEILHAIEPDIVISCLRGEFDQQLEFHQQLACALQKSKTVLYYFSTTNVFDGDFSIHHTETDLPVSETDYGNFKIKCEHTLKERLGERVTIIRIPQIWGKDSPRLNQLKESISNHEIIDVYSNLECNNLLDTQLAKQMRYILEQELKGIFHLGSIDMMTQAEFVERILRRLTNQEVKLRYHLYEEIEETRYFGLKSVRRDIRSELQITNEEIISQLVG